MTTSHSFQHRRFSFSSPPVMHSFDVQHQVVRCASLAARAYRDAETVGA
jgi:hypothetical protein